MFTQLNINVGLSFAAFIVGLFCLVAETQKNLNRLQHRTFFYICISCVAAPLFSFIGEVLITFCNVNDGIGWLLMACKALFFMFHSFLAPSYALYVLSLNGTMVGRKKRIWFIYWIPALFIDFFNIVNAFLPSDIRPLYTFNVDANGMFVYSRGPLAIVFYIVAAGYAAYGLFAFIRNIKALTGKKIFSMSFFIGIIFIGVLIQLIRKDIRVESFFESISVLSFLVILESDKETFNRNTELYNDIAFSEDNATAMAAKRQYSLITIKSPDYFQYLEMLGNANFNAIELQIARFLSSIYKSQFIYHLASGSYAIMVYSDEENEIDNIVEKIQKRFEGTWGSGKLEISPNWIITIAKVPDDIDDPSQLHYLFLGKTTKTEEKVSLRKSASLQFIKRRSKIEGAIARGLRDNNFKVYYQPIWDAKRNRIVSAEALLRLIDPELGFIGPNEFIPVAEENGTIIDIGIWYLNQHPILCPIQLRTQCVRNWVKSIKLATLLQLSYTKSTTILWFQIARKILNQIGSIISSILSLLFLFENSLSDIPIHHHTAEIDATHSIATGFVDDSPNLRNKTRRLRINRIRTLHFAQY